jgi:hypothetical protein
MKQYHQKYTIYIFYILVFLVIFLSNLSPKILYEENIKQNDIIIVCITSLFCIFLLYVLILLYKKSKENFKYELTSEKKCCCEYKKNEECKKLSKNNYKISEKNISNVYWENDFYNYETDYGIDDDVLEDNILEDNILKIIY